MHHNYLHSIVSLLKAAAEEDNSRIFACVAGRFYELDLGSVECEEKNARDTEREKMAKDMTTAEFVCSALFSFLDRRRRCCLLIAQGNSFSHGA